jgi:hypothetical protein
MRTHRTTALILFLALLAFSLVSLAEKTKEHPTRDFMRMKLGYSQGILEGLTLEKFDMVITNATALRSMSVTNAFLALGNPYYLNAVTNFQKDVDALLKAANDSHLDDATKAYQTVSRDCVQCHKQFRRDQFFRSQLK